MILEYCLFYIPQEFILELDWDMKHCSLQSFFQVAMQGLASDIVKNSKDV